MALNYLQILFLFNAFFVASLGMLINVFEPILPQFLIQIYRYGKFTAKVKNKNILKLEVPKKWFQHFYLIAAPLSCYSLFLVYRRYYLNNNLPNNVQVILDHFLGHIRKPMVPAANTLLASIIFMIHCCKRYYESYHVSVFSDGKMNISVYLIGFIHYFGAIMSIIGESEGFVSGTQAILDWSKLTFIDYTFAFILLLSSYLQYKCNRILANLRKDKSGKVVTKEYKVPEGGLFEYVSAPLQLTEIIIYLCLSTILRNGSTIHFILIWVICNQMECAYLTHQWSLKALKNYPRSRKIIIPFLF